MPIYRFWKCTFPFLIAAFFCQAPYVDSASYRKKNKYQEKTWSNSFLSLLLGGTAGVVTAYVANHHRRHAEKPVTSPPLDLNSTEAVSFLSTSEITGDQVTCFLSLIHPTGNVLEKEVLAKGTILHVTIPAQQQKPIGSYQVLIQVLSGSNGNPPEQLATVVFNGTAVTIPTHPQTYVGGEVFTHQFTFLPK